MASSSPNLWVLLGLGIAGILIMTKKLKRAVRADFGAFIERLQLLPPSQPLPPKAPHPLTGLSFAVSDVFDVEGLVTGFGNPDWSRTHEPATRTCPVVAALVDGGATCVGKTVVDDMALGVSGENRHYESPTNPAAPARVPGGASSGAAVAVAAKLADFSLGIDTDGGVRLPAGNCAVVGFRPSHGTVSLSGVIPVSESLDTVGWFAKDPSVLRRVGHVLLQVPYAAQRKPRTFVIADDCFQLSKLPADRTQVVIKSIEKLYGRQVLRHENLGDYIKLKVPSLKTFSVGQSNGDGKSSPLGMLANAMQIIKCYEFRQNHNEWINSVKPTLDPVISAQLREASDLTDADVEKCRTIRIELRSAIDALVKDDGILVIPTALGPPPKLEAKENYSKEYLIQATTLSSVASMSGCCQVAVPLGIHEKCPVSLSLLARHGADRFLLDTLQSMYTSLQEQLDTASKPKVSSKAMTNEESANIAKEKGNQAFKDKQWQRAIGFYTEAIKLNSTNATYYSNRAAAYLEIGSYIQAEADCSQAIDLDKKNVKSYLRRGTSREMLGYYKEAMDDFGYALVLEPNNKRASQSLERLRKLFQ
ncbi:outer envelope protein 64, chloroplastic-like isoform X1 [Salvia hispanica]|uniref:outer envelope protein 64, chloroplastic-like isoform X1 n=1 Tax=Salvia hispanica TaxID=49212 RepID=UPI002009754B|nr:outer envelope protein 64, chloroplastic-like isoform X1 [Salvia hispanica]